MSGVVARRSAAVVQPGDRSGGPYVQHVQHVQRPQARNRPRRTGRHRRDSDGDRTRRLRPARRLDARPCGNMGTRRPVGRVRRHRSGVVGRHADRCDHLPDVRPSDLEWRPGTDELAIANDMGTNREPKTLSTPVTVYTVSTGELRLLGSGEAAQITCSRCRPSSSSAARMARCMAATHSCINHWTACEQCEQTFPGPSCQPCPPCWWRCDSPVTGWRAGGVVAG